MNQSFRHVRPIFLAISLLMFFRGSTTEAHSAALAGGLSVIPGLGQAYNGDYLEGGAWFTVIGGLYALSRLSPIYIRSNRPGRVRSVYAQAAFDLLEYNMYDAYRDGKPSGQQVSQANVFQNYFAAFNPLNLIDPIGAPVVGYAAVLSSTHHFSTFNIPTQPFYFGFVGMGEEALNRGFLFPAFSQLFSSKFAGATVSSVVFVAEHVTNGVNDAFNPKNALTRFTLGMIWCWQVDHNRYELGKNIFAHTWYDVLVTRDYRVGEQRPSGVAGGIQIDIP